MDQYTILKDNLMRASRVSGLMLFVYITGIYCTGNVHSTDGDASSNVVHVTAAPDWLEMELWGFRLWMIIGLVVVGIMIVVIALCCIFDCRIPRTKQDIQARIEKQEAAKRATHKQQQSRDDNKPGEDNPTPRITLGGPWNRSALFREESDSNRSRRKFQETEIDKAESDVNRASKEKHYGRRMVYIPGKGIVEDDTGSMQFRPDPECTANSLASLHQQPYSRV